ncbi:hypothetical protein PHMEG_00014561 [Phytophthora megakarya]|uniref:DNA mismatch repair proteins mutS family domain-containing protein n=1 Tax=Phytophthora megakarya TaxID=4795 RepID=A0A225W528_9STRA|nr:hypothetical protein PHMEG_00014561 [Phytophthora megakarya]
MSWMLNHGDGRSLFLIDEFGKGTADLDGIALLSSIINYLVKTKFGASRPRVVLTTHFLEIFRLNLLEATLVVDKSTEEQSRSLSDTARVVCTVMASTDVPESYSVTSNAVPLYELRRGIANHSNALTCAAKCGIPHELIERAQQVLDFTKRGAPIPSRQQSTGPSPEEQLAVFFMSIDDWQSVEDDVVGKFLAMSRMTTQ